MDIMGKLRKSQHEMRSKKKQEVPGHLSKTVAELSTKVSLKIFSLWKVGCIFQQTNFRAQGHAMAKVTESEEDKECTCSPEWGQWSTWSRLVTLMISLYNWPHFLVLLRN